MMLFTSCHAGVFKQRSLVSEVVLQQTVTVIPPHVPQFIPPIQLSAQIDAAVSILMVVAHRILNLTQEINCLFCLQVSSDALHNISVLFS